MTADRPIWARETAALALVSTDLHEQRATAYPALVAAGKLPAAAAEVALRAAAAIAHDWRRRAGQAAGEPAHATRAERIATLEQAVAGQARRLAKARAAVTRDSLARLYAYADLPEIDRARLADDFAEAGLITDPAVRPWLYACEYAALIDTLLWWERQPLSFDALAQLTAALRAAPSLRFADAA